MPPKLNLIDEKCCDFAEQSLSFNHKVVKVPLYFPYFIPIKMTLLLCLFERSQLGPHQLPWDQTVQKLLLLVAVGLSIHARCHPPDESSLKRDRSPSEKKPKKLMVLILFNEVFRTYQERSRFLLPFRNRIFQSWIIPDQTSFLLMRLASDRD